MMKNAGDDMSSRLVHPPNGPPYRRGYDPTLFYIDGREYSFEEVRAARFGSLDGLDSDDAVIINTNARLKALEKEKKRALQRSTNGSNSMDAAAKKKEEEARKRRDMEERRKLKEAKLKMLEDEERALARLQQDLEQSPARKGNGLSGAAVGDKRRRELDEVPVAATQKKITSFMTGKEEQPAGLPNPSKKSRTSPSGPRTTRGSYEEEDHRAGIAKSPTMTVNTKNALAKLLPMFRDGANCGHTTNITTNLPKGSTTPTMTINTRSAHASIASMFAAPLFDDEESEEQTTNIENPSPAGNPKKRGLAVHQVEKKITFGDVLKKELRHTSPRTAGIPGKRTNADAIREALEEQENGDEDYTQDYVDTTSLSQVQKRRASGVGFQIYEDLDAGVQSPPKPRRLEMNGRRGDIDGERDESFLAALDDTQQLYDRDQSTMFGLSDSRSSTPMKGAALKVFEDADLGGNGTRDLSLSNIRCSFGGEMDGTPPVRLRSIVSGEDGDTSRGGNTTAYYSGHNNSTTSSFTGFTPSPSRHPSSNGKTPGGHSVRRSSHRNAASTEQTPGMTPLTYRKGFEPHAVPPRTPFAPKNENVQQTKSPSSKTPSPLKRVNGQQQQLVDPFNASLHARLIASLEGELRSYPGFIDCSNEKAPGAKILRVPKGRRVSMGGLDPSLQLRDCPPLEVERRIGEGAFASVFLVERTDVDPMFSKPLALKVQEPSSAWEWYIANQIQQRVPEGLGHCFIKFYSIHMYKDKSLILMDHYQYSLQDLISLYRVSGKPMDEVLVIYYTIEIMKMLDSLHKAGIIHGDIKPDNFMIRNDACEQWDNWGTGIQGGWHTKGLVLIDYGRGIDTTLFGPNTRYTSDIGADTFRCPEMKEGKPWTLQADLFAFLGVVHCMLHSDYMDTIQYKDGAKMRWKPRENFKRYWQSDKLWKPLFDTFLNIEDCDHIPDLGHFINVFEDYLISSRKSLSVRTLLSKQGIMMHENQNKGG